MPFGIVVALLPLSLVSHSYLQASPFETLPVLIFLLARVGCGGEWGGEQSSSRCIAPTCGARSMVRVLACRRWSTALHPQLYMLNMTLWCSGNAANAADTCYYMFVRAALCVAAQ